MDDNETKVNSNSAPSLFDQRRASLGVHHDLLLDRLTRRPEPRRGEPARPPRIAAKTVAVTPDATPAAVEGQTPPVVLAEERAEPHQAPRQDERRKSVRRRMLKAGVLSFNGSFSGLKCTVRDLSDGGARLKVDQLAAVPSVFELIIEIDGLYAKSSVAWRRAPELGVRFLEPPRMGAKRREQVITPRA